MINFFYQDNNSDYIKKANNYFKNDIWVNGKIITKFEENIEKKFSLSCII